MKQIAIAMLIVTILAGASGGFYGLRIATPGVEHREKEARAEDKPAATASLQASAGLFDLPPIVTNLSVPQDTWIRLEASLLFDEKAPHPEALGAEIAGDILAFLRTTTLTQIQGVAGLQNLRQDLNERVAICSNGAVKEIVIRTLVLQ